jgi:uncharacterized membrane protein
MFDNILKAILSLGTMLSGFGLLGRRTAQEEAAHQLKKRNEAEEKRLKSLDKEEAEYRKQYASGEISSEQFFTLMESIAVRRGAELPNTTPTTKP